MNDELRKEVARWLRYADVPDITAEEALGAVEDAARLVAAVRDDLSSRLNA